MACQSSRSVANFQPGSLATITIRDRIRFYAALSSRNFRVYTQVRNGNVPRTSFNRYASRSIITPIIWRVDMKI